MTGIGLHIGLKALLTSQAGLEVTGHNVANANTPGYSRQSMSLGSSMPLHLRGRLMGTGVDPGVVTRTIDALLARRIVSQASGLARAEASAMGYARIESLLGEPGELGISARLGSLFGALSDLSGGVHDGVLRGAAVQQSAGLAAHLRDLAAGLDGLAADSLAQVPLDLTQINRLGEEIAQLNLRISELEAQGTPANDLRDSREMRLGELAKLVDVTYQEQPSGALTVSLGGRMLVGSARAYALESASDAQGGLELRIQGGSVPLSVVRGGVAARMELGRRTVPELRSQLDVFARNLILEFNRAHSTGVPAQGYFRELVAAYPVQDSNGNGNRHDELLSNAGLPFDIQSGELQVNVTDIASGAVTTHRIPVDPNSTTVGGFIAALGAIPGISASLDPKGHLRVAAVPGKGFDFAARIDPRPDDVGSFGGGQASLATAGSAPFALADGDTLELVGPAGAFTVTLQASDFAAIGQASASEVAAVLNADPGLQANGLRAVEVDGRLVLQTHDTGAQAQFTVQGGSALAALGWSAGTNVNGQDLAVEVAIQGSYSGAANDRYTFTPNVDGTIGVTPGLRIEVRDAAGQLVTTLDVGEGYQPGTELDVAHGVRVSFGVGEVSADHNDLFALDLVADSDSADVLVALGLNALFTGTGAADIALRADILDDPSKLSGSSSGLAGDNGALLRMLGLESNGLAGLDGQSLSGFYGGFVAGIAYDASAANNAFEIEGFLMDGLLQRRDQISGVNVDEELVNLLQYEQSYQAASRYIQVVSRLGEELLALI